MLRDLYQTIDRIHREDPAAGNRLEILLTYPGLHAVFWHRLAHVLWRLRVPLLPRLLSQTARWFTLIEIHPGARLGKRLFIDHGAAVVIGETAEVGDDVLLYHQVTLGGTSTRREKRHPTLGDGVVVGAGAALLGPIRVGNHARIGAGSVVLRDIPDHATVVGIPGRVVFIGGQAVATEEAAHPTSLPDPEAQAIKALAERVQHLEQKLERPLAPGSGAVEEFLHGAGI